MEKDNKKIEEKVENVKTEDVKVEVKKETKPEVSIVDIKKLYSIIEEQNEKLEALSKKQASPDVSPFKTKKTEAPVEKEQKVPSIQKTEEPKKQSYSNCIGGVYTG